MKKLFMMAALIVGTMPIAAQETYENVKIAQEDLNDSAGRPERYGSLCGYGWCYGGLRC